MICFLSILLCKKKKQKKTTCLSTNTASSMFLNVFGFFEIYIIYNDKNDNVYFENK